MAFSMSMYFGTGQVDSHTGGSGRDWIWGEAGNDRLAGGAGDDFIYGGAGVDTIDGGADNDIIYGGAGDATNASRQMLRGGTGDDIIHGGEHKDGIYGGLGSDVLFGGAGDERMDGGNVWDPATTVRRDNEDGDDVIYGGAGDDRIRGGGGDDVLFGGEGNDYLTAQQGDDVLHGGAGNDRVQSSWGDDVLTGGPGEDEFDFRSTHIDFGTDLITDFNGEEDEIQLWDGYTDAQKADLVRGITYSGPTGARTSATIDLSHSGLPAVTDLDLDVTAVTTSGVIKVLFDGTGNDFTIDDFWSSS